MIRSRVSFLRSLVASILLVALVPLIVVSAGTYAWSRHSLYEEQVRFARSSLEQIVSSFELAVRGIHSLGMSYAYDPAFVRFDRMLISRPYERLLAGAPGLLEPAEQYAYLTAKQDCFGKLVALKSIAAYVHSAYYFAHAQGVLLTDTYSTHELGTFRDRAWVTDYEAAAGLTAVLNKRSATGRDGAAEVTTFLYVFKGVDFAERRSGLVVNIDQERLFASVMSRIVLSPDARVVVATRDGRRIMPASADGIPPLPAPEVRRGTPVARTLAAEGSTYLAIAAAAETDWVFWMLVPERSVTGHVSRIVTTNWILSFSVLFVTAALGFLVSARVYSPIRRLLGLVGPGRVDVPPAGDIGRIEDGIRRLSADRLQYLARIEEMVPLYRRMVLHEIVKGNSPLPGDITEQFTALRMPVEPRDVVVFAVNARGDDFSASRFERIHGLERRLEAGLFGRFPGMLVDCGEDHVVGVVNCRAEAYDGLVSAIRGIWESEAGVHPAFGVVGVGRHCSSVAQSHLSYADAREAMHYSILRDTGAVVSIAEVRSGGDVPWTYPEAGERALCGHIAVGDRRGASAAFRDLIARMEAHQTPLHSLRVQHQFLRLLGAMEEQLSNHGIPIAELAGSPGSLYQTLSDMDAMELVRWFEGLVERASEAVHERMAGKKYTHVEALRGALEADCGITVSLETAADRLHLNPSYLSRIVREVTGRSFVEYITTIRIEKAKRLLGSPDCTVQDTAFKVGYSNANYFIRIFRTQTGMTPGQYRRSLGLLQGA